MKKIWIALLPLFCLLGVPSFAQLYNNGAAITISGGTTVVVNSSATSTVGFYNQGTVQNNGKLVIGIPSGMGQTSIQNIGVFNNNACAELDILAPLNNSSTFVNSGLFSINTSSAHTNSSLVNNGIMLYFQNNLIPNVINNEIIIAPTNSNECGEISPAFILDNPVEFTVLGVFTDDLATLSAGTYEAGTNTFTPTVQLEEGIYDYFVKIEDVNDCISIVPWELTTEDCCDAPVAICQPFTAFLIGNSVTITAQDVNNNSIADCGLQSIMVSPNSFTCSHVGTPQLVTLTVTDVRGKNNSCSATVTVADNTSPTIQCFNQTVSFNGEESITLDSHDLVEANDSCGVLSITLSPNSISSNQIGQTVPVNVTVTDVNNNTSICTSMVTVSGLPEGWSQNPDGIGCNGGNDVDYNTQTQVWTATSTNCYYSSPFNSDASGFAQRSLCGDGSITAQVTGISGTALGWAGVIMRETNAPGAKKAQLTTNFGGNQSRREFRVTTNGTAFPQNFPAQNRYWLRIVRSGNQFVMYNSPNGTQWFPVGSQTIVMSSCIQMGLVSTNYSSNSTVSSTFANVSFTGNGPVQTAPLAANGYNTAKEQYQADFSVYPNPTSGELNLDLKEYIGKDVQIELYSLEGRLMQTDRYDEILQNTQTLLLEGYSSGMYFVKLKSEGLPDVTKRIVLTTN